MRTDRGGTGQDSSACSSSSSTPRAARARARDRPTRADQPGGVGGRPDLVAEGADLGAAGGAPGLGVGRAAAGLLLVTAGVAGEQHRQPLAPGGVVQNLLVVGPAGAAAQVVDVALEPLHRHPVPPPGQRHHHVVDRLADLAPQRPAQHLGHPHVALEDGGPRVVDGAHRHPAGEVGDRGLLDVDLAEGGQHLLDVAQEGAVGADDQDAGAGQLAAVRVEQVGGAVQADRGLAGARGALHADRLGERGAHDVVLVGLDGRDDVAHRAAARPLDLGAEELPRARRRRCSRRSSS